MKPPAEFVTLIDSAKLRYFTAEELWVKVGFTRNGVTNGPPPEGLWKNIVPTARMLDEIRHRAGVSIELLSGFRDKAYNKAVGGEPNSFHMRFMALDFAAKTKTPRQLHTIAKAVRTATGGNGGLGLYPGFVHIDCRRGAADW